MPKPKTRAQWAARIKTAHKETVGAILKLGGLLLAAKRALARGAFLKMIEDDLPFTASTAQRLMKIADDPRLTDAAHVQLLPAAWGTLYELTKLPDGTFAQAVSTKTIHPKMTRGEARFIKVKVEAERARVVVPYYEATEEPEPQHLARPAIAEEPLRLVDAVEPSPVKSLALPQVEKAVADLVNSVTCGELVVDDAFAARVRFLTDQLLSLIEQKERPRPMLQ